ncbi:hypothetical protein [Seonamhaeicola marinus]|uniref:Uncharacterized protein n=1 Tax=Seonamhaeicola marinus TaxID=1912246 RepID=A0A5D0HSA9_9FLAO|nr:hypothetical protein [Seonamhaeicola marinus]TYA74168.1 hypothetical protein FUA24_12580 [Seonamhaeicola marinus]
MKNLTLVLCFCFAILISCKAEKDSLNLAKVYYDVLNTKTFSKIPSLIGDSIVTKELSYTKVFSQEDYIELLKWDSVFNSEYEILKIEKEQDYIKAQVSQKDRRILFLNETPIVTNQILRFKNSKISNVEIVEYIVFNDSIFSNNRTKLLNWVESNHPELNGFIFDQTKLGAIKYVKAIDLYLQSNK